MVEGIKDFTGVTFFGRGGGGRVNQGYIYIYKKASYIFIIITVIGQAICHLMI